MSTALVGPGPAIAAAGTRSTALVTTLAHQAVAGLHSPHSRRVYAAALGRFISWCGGRELSRQLVQGYMSTITSGGMSRLALAAIKKLVNEGELAGVVDERVANGIRKIGGVKCEGVRQGNWLGIEAAQLLLGLPAQQVAKGEIDPWVGARDSALLAALIGCALRRAELVAMRWENLRTITSGGTSRTILEIELGKGGKFRTVPVPEWVMDRMKAYWTVRAALYDQNAALKSDHGAIGGGLEDLWVRVGVNGSPQGSKFGTCNLPGSRLTVDGVWHVVKHYAELLGVPQLAPHDLRRTGARLMREGGADLEQIRLVLGHATVETTVKYLGGGVELGLGKAATDRMGLV